jgi:hypothetical protein
MGNRAVLAFSNKPADVGVYLHWVGSPDQVEEILRLCRERGYRTPAGDPVYAMARLIEAACEVAGRFESVGVGVGVLKSLDTSNGDNGLYIIGGDWVVVRHQQRA